MASKHPFRTLHNGLLTRMSALILCGSVALPNVAFAQEDVRYKKKTRSAAAKSGLLNTKFKKAKKAQERKDKRPAKKMSGQDFGKKREIQTQALIDKKIELTKRLLASSQPSDAEYPDFLYRLADHFLEKKAYYDMQAGALYEKIYDAEEKGQKSKERQLIDKQKRLNRQKLEMSKQAAKVYNNLVTKSEFRSYKRMDEALFFYAFELGELKQEKLMTKVYQKLISDYPNSQYIPQAYLAFADYYYGKDEIQKAVRLYERVTTFKDSPVYAFALYMLGWCHLNPLGSSQPLYDKSLAYFIATIKATKEGRAGSEENGRALRRDARRDLVRAYVHASKPSAAWSFFQKWGNGPGKKEKDARRMMLLLANGYFGEGMYAESTYIYRQLQDIFPNDEENCSWQGKIVVNTLATDQKQVQWKETERLADMWEGFSKKKVSKKAKKQCRDEARNTTKQMATTWHDEAVKTQRADTYALSEKAYNKFLSQFPKDKDAYELQFYYGELLWALAEQHYNSKDSGDRKKGLNYFRKAHDSYLVALKKNPKGKLTQELALAQMLAMKNHLEYDETGGKAKACKTNHEGVCVYKEKKVKKKKRNKDSKAENVARDYPVTDYTPDEKKMLESYDVYTKYVKDKKDKELPKIMYHRAKLMMIHNRFDEAKPLLTELIEKFDGQVYAAWCSEMLLDLLTIKWLDKDNDIDQTLAASAELEKWGRKLQKMKTWRHPDAERVRETLPTLLAGIGWREAKAYSDAGTAYVKGEPGGDPKGFKKCAEKYVQVFNEYEDHPDAAALLYSGAICAEAGYMVSNAIQLRKNLLELFPDSQYAKKAHWSLAQNYQAVAYYKDAAEQFERFAERYPGDKETPNALQNAYLFRLGLGDQEKAAEDIRKYESMYKKKDPGRAAGIFWARFATLTTDDERLKLARDYIRTYGKRGGVDRLIVAHAKIGEILWTQSCEGETTFNSCLKIERKAALSGAKTVAERKRLEAKQKRIEQKKARQKFKVPARCGEETQAVVTVFNRDKRKAKEAQKQFATVLKLAKAKAKIPPDDFQRIEDYRNAVGMAMVYEADQDYEAYLRLTVPTGLSFAVETWKKGQGVKAWDRLVKKQEKKAAASKKKLMAYNKKKTELAARLDKSYGGVPKTKSRYWALAAAARTGMVMRNFADQLYRAEVPDSFKSEDEYFAYCDALSDMAKPAEVRAQNAFNYCISRSTEFQYFNTFSRMCEEEMQQQNPEKFPATNEYFGTSVYTQSRIAKAKVRDSASGDRSTTLRRNKKGKKSTN